MIDSGPTLVLREIRVDVFEMCTDPLYFRYRLYGTDLMERIGAASV